MPTKYIKESNILISTFFPIYSIFGLIGLTLSSLFKNLMYVSIGCNFKQHFQY